jgi:T-complex protein 1 subunit alpha
MNATRAARTDADVLKTPTDGVVKIAMLDMNLQRHRMAMGVTIQVTDPAEVENIKKNEMDITKEKNSKILETGAKVILTTKGLMISV